MQWKLKIIKVKIWSLHNYADSDELNIHMKKKVWLFYSNIISTPEINPYFYDQLTCQQEH